jgi:hypothetical protein
VTQIQPPQVVILSHPRSGTHLLQAALNSHPSIHGRGECVLAHMRGVIPNSKFIFANKPEYLNTAIVMYGYFNYFERVCGSIFNFKTIHLLRKPMDAALSLAQLEADKLHLGEVFSAHRRYSDPPPVHSPISRTRVAKLCARATQGQKRFTELLRHHTNILTVTYEELTNNSEIQELPDAIAAQLLAFLSVKYCRLTTTLGKTAPVTYKFRS